MSKIKTQAKVSKRVFFISLQSYKILFQCESCEAQICCQNKTNDIKLSEHPKTCNNTRKILLLSEMSVFLQSIPIFLNRYQALKKYCDVLLTSLKDKNVNQNSWIRKNFPQCMSPR